MGYMDNVELADELAGGPREDLDDVIIDKPVKMMRGCYRVPEELPLLDYLEQQVMQHDFTDMLHKFYDWPTDRSRYDVMQEILHNYKIWNDPDSVIVTRGESIGKIRRMYCKYGAAVGQANPHLTKRAVYDHLVTLGYDGSTWAFYQFLHREGGTETTNTERTRLAKGKR